MTSKPPIYSAEALEKMRARLDLIDQRLHDTLLERMDYTGEVAALKKNQMEKNQAGEATAFRPAREAQLLRQRVAAHRGDMPLATLIHIWRELFSASLHRQQDFWGQDRPVLVYATNGEILASAQGWAGAAAEIVALSDLNRFFAQMSDHPAMIGLIPTGIDGAWWQDMGAMTHIVARWPFLATDKAAPLYVLANMMPEMSGDDVSLYAQGADISADISADIIEIDGFILPQDQNAPQHVRQGRFLGCYARGLDA